MAPFAETSLAWLRRQFAWSNSAQSWRERAGAAALLLAAWLGWSWRGSLSTAQLATLAAVWVLLLAVLLRRGWLRLLGPVFAYEMVRAGRRDRVFFFRLAYAAALGGIVVMVLATNSISRYRAPSLSEQARLANLLFSVFACTQFLAVVLLTPGYVAGSVTDEKERHTLEFMLATDLRGREIVLSKLAARTVQLLVFLLAGLPVLSCLQFYGGIDPGVLLATFAATGLTLVSLAALSVLASVLAGRSREAITLTYLFVVAGVGLGTLAFYLVQMPGFSSVAGFGFTAFGVNVTVRKLVEWLNAGNPLTGMIQVLSSAGGNYGQTLLDLLKGYAAFHGTVAVVCTLSAVYLLRPVALRQLFGTSRAGDRRVRRVTRARPAVGDSPMVWREVVVEGGRKWNVVVRLFAGLLFLASLVPVGFIVWDLLERLLTNQIPSYYGRRAFERISPTDALWDYFGQSMNVWVRTVTTIVGPLALILVAVRAAGSVAGERDKQTLECLLTTPLSDRAILGAKWLGAFLGGRGAWAWLLTVWALGLASGGLHPLAALLLLVTWFSYAALMASIGLWYSVNSRTTAWATLRALAAVFVVGGGYWLFLLLGCILPISLMGPTGLGRGVEQFLTFCLGLTIPVVLPMEGFRVIDLDFGPGDRFMGPFIGGAVTGVLASLVLAELIFEAALVRFRQVLHRQPRRGRPPRDAGRKKDPAPPRVEAAGAPDVVLAELEPVAVPVVEEIPEVPLAEEPAGAAGPLPHPSSAGEGLVPSALRGGGLGWGGEATETSEPTPRPGPPPQGGRGPEGNLPHGDDGTAGEVPP